MRAYNLAESPHPAARNLVTTT